MADLKTDYKDDVLDTTQNTKRKYQMIDNGDGTVSFEDVTEYLQQGDSFGADDINDTNEEVNIINDNLDHVVYDLNVDNSITIVKETTTFPHTYTPTTDGMLICRRIVGTSAMASCITINGFVVAVSSSNNSYSMTIPVRHGDTIVFDYLGSASRIFFCPRVTS